MVKFALQEPIMACTDSESVVRSASTLTVLCVCVCGGGGGGGGGNDGPKLNAGFVAL